VELDSDRDDDLAQRLIAAVGAEEDRKVASITADVARLDAHDQDALVAEVVAEEATVAKPSHVHSPVQPLMEKSQVQSYGN